MSSQTEPLKVLASVAGLCDSPLPQSKRSKYGWPRWESGRASIYQCSRISRFRHITVVEPVNLRDGGVCSGSWLCENTGASTDGAMSEPGISFARIVVATTSDLRNRYFDSDPEEFVFTQPGSNLAALLTPGEGPQSGVKLKQHSARWPLAGSSLRRARHAPRSAAHGG